MVKYRYPKKWLKWYFLQTVEIVFILISFTPLLHVRFSSIGGNERTYWGWLNSLPMREAIVSYTIPLLTTLVLHLSRGQDTLGWLSCSAHSLFCPSMPPSNWGPLVSTSLCHFSLDPLATKQSSAFLSTLSHSYDWSYLARSQALEVS